MKTAILAVMLMASTAFADDMVFRVGGAEYRLTDQPCRVKAALDAIKPEFAGQQRAGWRMTKERTIAFCWIAVDQQVVIMDEDGRMSMGPVELFKAEPGA